jgi:hypothetical protein
MNTDKRRLKTEFLSAFIGVHQRPKLTFSQLLTVAVPETTHARGD